MNDPAVLDLVWRELRRRGLVNSTPPQALVEGNRDRAKQGKQIYRVQLADGSSGKLTIGADLGALVRHTNAWAAALPNLTPPLLFEERIGACHVVGEKFADGPSLRSATLERTLARRDVHRAFSELVAQLRATQKTASDSAAIQQEWDSWSAQLASLPIWTEHELSFLRNLLAALQPDRLAGASCTRWVHGDLTDQNIIIEHDRVARLIDPEFSERSHFFDVEAARFYALSDSAIQQPALFQAILPRPTEPAFLQFWLTQITREVRLNSSKYAARWLPHRLSMVRTLSDRLFGTKLGCPWSAEFASWPPGTETVQLFWSSPNEPTWSEDRSQRLQYNVGGNQTIFIPLASRPPPWRLDPSSSSATSVVHSVRLLTEQHQPCIAFSGDGLTENTVTPLANSNIQLSSSGLSIHAASGDPQFLMRGLEKNATSDAPCWLELELCTSPAPTRQVDRPLETHHTEESRWLDLEPALFRIGGWYHNGCDGPASAIHALVDGVSIATSHLSPRPDVVQYFSGSPEARNSGFQLDLPFNVAGRIVSLLARHERGTEVFFRTLRVPPAPLRATLTDNFARWAAIHDRDPDAPAKPLESKVKFSLLLPVFNTDPRFLEECLDSVQRQHYCHWELRIVDDASTADVGAVLSKKKYRDDARITVQRRATNGGISRATNDALAAATGDYVVLIDHDDLIRPHALYELAVRLNEDSRLDAIYSDEDKIDGDGVRRVALLKPDPSPLFLCGVMYVGHLLCIRTAVARSLDGFDPQYDGIQDYEFFLRLTERTTQIAHHRRMLYHWRMSAASSALSGNIKGDMDALQLKAVCTHLERTGRPARAVALGGHRVRLLPQAGKAPVDCTLIVAEQSYAALFAAPAPVIVASNNPAGVFEAARSATTTFVAIITFPLRSAQSDWLDQLLMTASQPNTGAVVPVLLDADGYVSSAGLLLNPDGAIVPIMHGFAGDGEGYNGSLACTREVLAVSPPCIVIGRETLLSVTDLALSDTFSDWAVDLCLALHTAGRRNVVCASARLHELGSPRAPRISVGSMASTELRAKWQQAFAQDDPFYPGLSDRQAGDYRLRTDGVSDATRRKQLHHYIDVPRTYDLPGGFLRMRGWSYSTELHLQQVRVVFPTGTISGRYGTHRPDVAAEFPDAPSPNTGFEVWGILPPGRYAASLEFQDEMGEWRCAETLAVNSMRRHRPIWMAGGSPDDLVHFQLGARPSHPPRPLALERFPQSKRIPPSALPRLTIVTPSYNQAHYLPETMRSVLDQTGVALNYSVQDGGSSDGSVETIQQFSSQFESWESVPDRGQAHAIALAFKRTSGAPEDLMAWINSDDIYLPGSLRFVAEYFARHPEVDAIYGHRILIDEQSHEIGRWFLPPHDNAMVSLNDYVPQETLFWRRRIWDKVGGIDPSFKFAMDWDLLLRFQAAGAKIVRVPYFLACFRIHAAQKTSAQMESVGQKEIDALRLRTFGRALSPAEIESNPRLLRYLRKSAWIEFLWRRFGIRHP
jgi:glycosyltransferase involved in cell wall biosynthesis